MFNDFTYDFETYPNAFTASFLHHATLTRYRFEISFRRNDLLAFIEFIQWCKMQGDCRWMGYNNVGFDYPITHFILENAQHGITFEDIYEKSQSIINTDFNDAFKNRISEDQCHIQQIDLFLIHHFNNKARRTSLKMLEFNMMSPNISDLPFPPGTVLTSEQIDTLIVYNDHDVDETFKFGCESISELEFREQLNIEYGVNWTNKPDTGIGKEFFVMQLEAAEPGCCYRQTPSGKKPNQTPRPLIYLEQAVFDYIQFERREFQAVVEWFKQQVITETKGVFGDIEAHRLGELANYAHMLDKKKKVHTQQDWELYQHQHPGAWLEERLLKSKKLSYYGHHYQAKTLNTVVDGFKFVFGTGGIHGATESGTFYSDKDYVIELRDVASYYPNLAVKNKLHPEHLGQLFCDIYADLYTLRSNTPKSDPKNKMLKLGLNGAGFGDTNSVYSPFYDPLHFMRVTINGQLLLCKLSEQLMKIPGLKMIQVNTDGVCYRVPRVNQPMAEAVCAWWEQFTLLSLDVDIYDVFAVRDCNNYIAVEPNGKVKRKGAYTYGKDLDWNQNFSSQVIAKAAEAAIVDGDDIETFIRSHTELNDFMRVVKLQRNMRLEIEVNRTRYSLENIQRYYVSNGGGELFKIMPPLPGKNEERHQAIASGELVTPCNDITTARWDNINYDYYIAETKKLVDPLRG